MGSYIQVQKKCFHCGNEFTAKTLGTKYCSHICNSRHYKKIKREEKLGLFHKEQNTKEKKEDNYNLIVQQKEFLNLDEAAKLIGASRRTITRLIAKEELKAGRIGRRIIIKRSEIDKLFI
jgi:excisionase family DNA binding protein